MNEALDSFARHWLADRVPAELRDGQAAAWRAMRTLAEVGAPANVRTHFVPGHFTGSLFVVDERGRVLLLRHKKLGKWLQPGGHLEPGESILAGALREGREETGLRTFSLLVEEPFDLDVHPIPARPNEPAHEHFDVRYLVQARSDEALAVSDESEDLRWVEPSDATNYTQEPSVLRPLAKIAWLRAQKNAGKI